MSTLKKFWHHNKAFIVFLILMFVFRSAIADWNDVPTASMKPTIVEGDRILVNKLAYDVRLPFSHVTLIELGQPERGDIIIFDSKASGKRLVKRVVGVPGDVIAMAANTLMVNGTRLDYKVESESPQFIQKTENLLGVTHRIQHSNDGSRLDTFAEITVPPGLYMVLGDNRDNSADSRVIGFVPRHEIVGRTRRVVVSLNYDNYLLPRSDRFWKTL